MEEKQESYQAYLKSFNTGYVINKHMPDVAKMIVKSLNDQSLWSEGFRDGVEQGEIDKQKDLPKFLRNERLNAFKDNKNQIKSKDNKDLDKD